MKKLILKPNLMSKLARLPDKVGELSYLGVDPNELLDSPIVAIVGTRKPTPYGKSITDQIASELARAGVVIVSGLAYGVDIIAAKACLSENASTIAVLPSGLNKIYPSAHTKLAEQIQEKGSIISEFPADHMPMRHDFLHRNRIIAALSDLVIITEAAERSGSLNTAMHALSMNIPICVVPGNINSPMSSGTNNLIKEGKAKMITSALDVLNMLNITGQENIEVKGNNNEENLVLDAIKSGIHESPLIQQETGMETEDFQMCLTMLEIDSKIHQDDIGNWHLK